MNDSEYGETWHKDGSLGSKQNCFNDFQVLITLLVLILVDIAD